MQTASNPASRCSEVSDQYSKHEPTPFTLLKRRNDTSWDAIVPPLLTHLFSVFVFVCIHLCLVFQQLHIITSECQFSNCSLSSQHDSYLVLNTNSFSLKCIHELIFQNFWTVQACLRVFVQHSWGSWLMFISAVGHLHFRPIFHPIYFSSSKERHFDVPQILLRLGLSKGEDWLPLVLQ